MNLDVAVCLPQETETVSLVRGIVSHALRTLGVTAECVDDIRLALSEACNNVIEHAALDDEYEIRLQVDEHRCVISVKNTGDGFDAEALAETVPDPTSPRGRGVVIMRALMDQVDFSSETTSGTIVRLVKGISVDPDSALARVRGDS